MIEPEMNVDFTPWHHYKALYSNLPLYIGKVFNETEPTTFYPNWHINYMAEYLEAVLSGQETRLIINVPPGYTKSVAVNIAFSTFALGRNPSNRILSASHSHSLSTQMSNKSRQVMQSDWYKHTFPGTLLNQEIENRQDFFKTTKNGFRQVVSVGGKITGAGGNIHLIDDPIDSQDAEKQSGVAIRKVNDWYDGTFYSRLRDKKKGVIIIIMQRLHEKDLTGHLLASKLDKYTHCCIPGVEDHRDGKLYAFGNFEMWRLEGELLCPKIEGPTEIAKAKERLGTLGFEGQYQQRPTPKAGGLIKKSWIKYYDKEPFFDQIVQSWDTAMKAGQLNDYSVCTTWGVTQTGYYLLDVLRKKMEYPLLKATAIEHARSWEADAIIIEDKASGMSLIQDLRNETELPIVATNPTVDKITRMSAQTARIEAGKMFLPKDKPWLSDFESELFKFPLSEHDDQIDSVSQFLKWVNKPKAQYQVRKL